MNTAVNLKSWKKPEWPCPECHGAGWVLDIDLGVGDACPACNATGVDETAKARAQAYSDGQKLACEVLRDELAAAREALKIARKSECVWCCDRAMPRFLLEPRSQD